MALRRPCPAAAPLCKALCLSNEDRDALADILTGLGSALTWPTLTRSGRKRLLAEVHWRQVRTLLGALGHHPHAVEMLAQIDQQSAELLAQGVAPPPLINGEDLIALGLRPGPIFGRLLDQAYDLQLEGGLADRDQAMVWLRRESSKFQV